jgi:hypothetical protein
VELQAVRRESLSKILEETLCILAVLKSQYRVVGLCRTPSYAACVGLWPESEVDVGLGMRHNQDEVQRWSRKASTESGAR